MSNEMNLPLNASAYGLIRDTKGQVVGDVFNPKHAAHIVRCANSHAALVEALQRLVSDSMASDFNEWWESFKEAELLSATVGKLEFGKCY